MLLEKNFIAVEAVVAPAETAAFHSSDELPNRAQLASPCDTQSVLGGEKWRYGQRPTLVSFCRSTASLSSDIKGAQVTA